MNHGLRIFMGSPLTAGDWVFAGIIGLAGVACLLKGLYETTKDQWQGWK